MNKTINPKFESFDIISEWSSEDHPEWWAKELEVHIKDMQNEGGTLQNYEVGEVFILLICSPKFKEMPNTELDVGELSKALVLDVYDESVVESYLKKSINHIGVVDIDIFDQRFRRLFNMVDWDQTAEVLQDEQ